MALETIAEANKYSRDDLIAGVVQVILEASPMFGLLPYKTVQGNALTYLREVTLGNIGFFDPGEVWPESTGTVVKVTVPLKIAGGNADVDQFLAASRSNENDLTAEVIAMKAKALARTIENELIYGDVDDVDPKGFDGLHEILGPVTGGQDVVAGVTTAGGPGTFQKLDEMIDKVRPGPADALIMSRRSRRQMRTLARSQGWDLALSTPGGINRPILTYSDLPILINDFMVDTEDVASGGFNGKTGDDTSSIFAVRFGEDGLHGLDTGAGIEILDLGDLEDKDAKRHRVRWYNALALMSDKALARLSGIDDQAWTN